MLEYLQSLTDNPYLTPYVLSLGIMIGIAIIEMVTAIAGIGLFSFVDNMLPDFDMPDVDMPDVDMPLHLSAVFFLHIGKVPMSILLVVFLTLFGLIGAALQLWVFHGYSNLAVLPLTLAVSVLILNRIGLVLTRIVPSTETYVVSDDDLLGCVAKIIIGTARADNPTSASMVDKYGERQKIMVLPLYDDGVFTKGQKVLLIEKKGSYFLVTGFDF